MRVTILTQPRCKITYKYLNIKILRAFFIISVVQKYYFFANKKREEKIFC